MKSGALVAKKEVISTPPLSIYFYSWQRGREGGTLAILYSRGTLGCPSDKPISYTTSLNIYYISDFQSDLRNKPT
ncbi:hypothetical protein ACN38_g10091 [Penicillium nordicum]|uniref:Uncharacterized protein n=1 Tax=Penicillium nordicum TaxID=229535 RepID=A0A0M8NTH4_9EURO|nr:hypothetical protein ACN38_g10091 [Penicillium nordicum]